MAKNIYPQEEKATSLKCPHCGCRHLFLIDTRGTRKRIIRVRQCRHCGRRTTTCDRAGSSSLTHTDHE